MNPIEQEAQTWKAKNIGELALLEMLTKRFGKLSPELETLAKKYPTYLVSEDTMQNKVLPRYVDKLAAKNFDAINVGYSPDRDQLGIGDNPPVGSIYTSSDTDNLEDVLPHEFIHRYQYEHPLASFGFNQAMAKNPSMEGLLSFILGRYNTNQVPDESMAYATEGRIPESLKHFYGGLIK
jgi:hypothetical protein